MAQLNLFRSPKDPLPNKKITSDDSTPKKGIEKTLEYQEYIKSTQWKHIRQTMLKLKNHQCERCGRKNNLEVHHKHYKNFKKESFSDLELLCKPCHFEADREREKEMRRVLEILAENNQYEAAKETYLTKLYGEFIRDYSMDQEFDEWLENKREEEWEY